MGRSVRCGAREYSEARHRGVLNALTSNDRARYPWRVGTHHQGSPDEVRALDAFIKLSRAHDTVGQAVNRNLADAGLTVSQFGTLEALFHLGPLSQREVGGKILKSSGNITLVIDNLEKRGLVRRVACPTDRRVTKLNLTEAGRTLTARIFPAHLREIVGTMAVLTSAEQTELARLTKKLGRASAERAAVDRAAPVEPIAPLSSRARRTKATR